MSCPTPEQLAAISLGLADDARLLEHAETCEACTRVRAAQSEAVSVLSAIHRDLATQHAVSRTQLFSSLPATMDRRSPSPWRRWALGGVAAAAVLLLSFIALAPNRLSAMERIEHAVRQISSLSCTLTNSSKRPPTGESPARTHHDERFIYWRAPDDADLFGDLHATTTLDSTWHRPSEDEPPLHLVDLVEIHPSGKPGILIDYLARRYYRVPALHARDINNSPPLLWLRAVRERAGKIVQELSSREINGRLAHGFLMTFDDRPEFKDYNPVEVWVDPQTDLPVEFRFRNASGDQSGYTEQWTVTDIQWNAELDPKLFDTTAPAGFIDVTLPNDEQSIAAIVDALKLYAELSGGQYPPVEKLNERNFATKFDAEACYREMLKLAGLTDANRDQWAEHPLFERIEKSPAGLNTLERILQSYKWLVGYYGDSVGPQDKEKVLLWWNIALSSGGDQYRVFYGDLRTEAVSGKEWATLVPPEIAQMTE